MKWHIVNEDGNPKQEGSYLAILIYDQWNTVITGERALLLIQDGSEMLKILAIGR